MPKNQRPYQSKWGMPKLGTSACLEYFLSWAQINSFFTFVLRMVSHIQEVSEKAHEALVTVAEIDEDLEEVERLQRQRLEGSGPIDELRFHRQFLLEVILVRHIENYLNYLSGLLFQIFVARPETLRSSETIELETVFSHDSMTDLVRTIAQRKVNSLSYSSFQDLVGYFRERFSLELFPKVDVPMIVEAVETRNISVHNRCVIDEQFVRKTGADPNLIGTTRDIYVSDIRELQSLLGWGVKTLDKACRSKLKIHGSRFNVGRLMQEEYEQAKAGATASGEAAP